MFEGYHLSAYTYAETSNAFYEEDQSKGFFKGKWPSLQSMLSRVTCWQFQLHIDS